MGWIGDKISRVKDKLDDLDRASPVVPPADDYRDEKGAYVIPGVAVEHSAYRPATEEITVQQLRDIEHGLRTGDYDLLVSVSKAIRFIEAWADKPDDHGEGFVVKQHNQQIHQARQLKFVLHRLANDPDRQGRAKCAKVLLAWHAAEGGKITPPAA